MRPHAMPYAAKTLSGFQPQHGDMWSQIDCPVGRLIWAVSKWHFAKHHGDRRAAPAECHLSDKPQAWLSAVPLRMAIGRAAWASENQDGSQEVGSSTSPFAASCNQDWLQIGGMHT